MVIQTELLAISKAYPIISVIVAIVLFFIGLKITTKLFKFIIWALAIIAIITSIVMIFY